MRARAAVALMLTGAMLTWGAPQAGAATSTVTFKGKDGDCKITIQSLSLDDSNKWTDDKSTQGKTDASGAEALLKKLIKDSPDFVVKLEDACKKNKNALKIGLVRNTSRVDIGVSRPGQGEVILDPADIAAAGDHMTGKPADVAKLKANLLAFFLAHEIDHLRASDKDDHADPEKGEAGVIGEPDKDANRVMKDLNVAVSRNEYGTKDKDGNLIVTFTVDGQKVVLDLTAFSAARSKAEAGKGSVQKTVDPEKVKAIPDQPCPATGSCYPPATQNDADVDGAKDVVPTGRSDNCPGVTNPRQVDSDHDGIGGSCDSDDDGDGWNAEFERAVGSTDACKKCRPETWALPATCSDTRDNDKDGFKDSADQSCAKPVVSTTSFPEPVLVNAVYPDPWRLDLGGVPEDTDLMNAQLNIALDMNLDGTLDGTAQAQGPVVIRRGAPAGPPDGRTMTTEMVFMQLVGTSSLGPITITQPFPPPPSGAAVDSASDGNDLPAQNDYFLSIRITGPGLDGIAGTGDDVDLHTQTQLHLGCIISGWPPYGMFPSYRNFGLVPLGDASDTHAGNIVTVSMSIAA